MALIQQFKISTLGIIQCVTTCEKMNMERKQVVAYLFVLKNFVP